MLFNSLTFALFFALVFALYVCLPHRARNVMLLLASYLFYGAWDWRFLALIWISTAVDYGVALRLASSEDPRTRRRLVAFSLVTNLSILGFFKYAGFFAGSLTNLLRPLGIELPPFTLEVVLPVGISFYTFQTLSYTIDVYRRQLEPTRDVVAFALFVAFFPQLVAGPIERARRLLPQIRTPRSVTWEGIGEGSWLVLWGLFKKAVVADNLALLVDAVYAPGSAPTGPEVALATFAFAFQIYCDFSGYTDIARGVARMLGFDLVRNFNLPYFASSPAEFWRRWHMSLSTWLRDYLFFSLGFRGGRARTLRNLGITMLLGGLWHGAAWNFVAWGAFHGALLILGSLAAPALERVAPTSRFGAGVWHAASIAGTFLLVCLGWVLFRAESLTQAGQLLHALVSRTTLGVAGDWLAPLFGLITPVLFVQILQARSGDLDVVLRGPVWLRASVYTLLFFGIVLLGEDFGTPFLYFQF